MHADNVLALVELRCSLLGSAGPQWAPRSDLRMPSEVPSEAPEAFWVTSVVLLGEVPLEEYIDLAPLTRFPGHRAFQ